MKINVHTSHPSAFISSRFLDLEVERSEVTRVLRESNLNINALDVKPASNDSSKKEIINGIKESDFVILIVGERYGSIIPQMTMSKKHSITWWEYKRAVNSFKKNVLVYFKRVNSENSIHYDEGASYDYEIKRKFLKEFKNELSKAHNPKFFNTPEELASEVKAAIIPTYRAGVQNLGRMNELLLKEVDALKQENERLKVNNQSNISTHSNSLGNLPKPKTQGLLAGLSDFHNSNNSSGLGGLLGAVKKSK